MKEWARKIPHPGYGRCGGRNRDCSKSSLDPLDRLFDLHDNALAAAEAINDQENRSAARQAADLELYAGLLQITEQDFKKIPLLTLSRPFLRRHYARIYHKAALAAFKPRP